MKERKYAATRTGDGFFLGSLHADIFDIVKTRFCLGGFIGIGSGIFFRYRLVGIVFFLARIQSCNQHKTHS
jgi:hypothetical protein